MKRKILNIFFGLVFVAGIGVLSYPYVSNLIQQYQHDQVINQYQRTVSQLDSETCKQTMEDAKTYNELISQSTTVSQALFAQKSSKNKYEDLINVGRNDVMSVIEIPKIDVKLPIYHGTDESKLQVGVGHYKGSSLPIGGKSTHTVLTGHSGLPSSRLFTDIDQLKKGDIFYITVLNQTIAYEVDQIKIVLPEELEDIKISKQEDYCTLVTCTPYGVNTHRLLVRGKRIAYRHLSNEMTSDIKRLPLSIVICIAVIIHIIIVLIQKRKKGSRA